MATVAGTGTIPIDYSRVAGYHSGMVAELAISLEPRGRRAAPLEVRVLGDVGESDLALLAGSRGTAAPTIKKLRDRHHALARCLAGGMKDGEASLVTGYDPSRISILKSDPTFRQLMAEYKEIAEGAFADFQTRAAVVTVEALNQIQEELEEDAERVEAGQDRTISLPAKLKIVETLADRTGHAPIAKSVQVSATVDLTSRLESARKRVLEGNKTIGTAAT